MVLTNDIAVTGTYITRQTWTLIEVATEDDVTIVSSNANMTYSDNDVLEVLEGDQLELECQGEGEVFPEAEYFWSIAGERLVPAGESLVPAESLLNMSVGLEHNGSVLTCSSRQYNSYSGDLMFQTSVSVMIIVQVPVLEFSSFTQSR